MSAEDEDRDQYVRLRSSDGHEFVVQRYYAMVSGTIKSMLSGPGQFQEAESNVVEFKEISSHVLEKVCKYFYFKMRHKNSNQENNEIPEFPIEAEVALELLMAANFLDV